MHAIKRAKVPPGTYDADNEWMVTNSADSRPVVNSDAMKANVADDIVKSGFTLKILAAGPIGVSINHTANHTGLDSHQEGLSDGSELKQYLDETLFDKALDIIEGPASSGVIPSAVLTHHGTTMDGQRRAGYPYGSKQLD